MAVARGTGCTATFAPGEHFLDCWPEIWKVIAADYAELLLQTPTRLQRKEDHKEKKKQKKDDKDKADDFPGDTPVQKKIRAVVEEFKNGRKENRGKYMSLAFTNPRTIASSKKTSRSGGLKTC